MMKTLILYLALFSISAALPAGEIEGRDDDTSADWISSADYLSPAEKEMVREINLVRTEPWSYIPLIKAELEKAQQDSVALSKILTERIHQHVRYVGEHELVETDTVIESYYETRVRAIRELLIELDTSTPLQALRPYEPLHSAAVHHVSNQNNSRYLDHLGADGSAPQERILKAAPHLTDGNENIARGIGSPREMIVQLLIDSAAPHRGHRKNILAPEWRYITCYQASELDEHAARWWVQEFAY